MQLQEKGYSITSVLVGFALLGALSLGVMQVMKNINQGQNYVKLTADEMELRTEIRMILDEERFCRVSLSPLAFKKSEIDEDTEGLDVELWLSNQAGDARTLKKFSATDASKNQHGKIKITSLKLVMNNGTGSDYSLSPVHVDMGEIRVVAEKQVGDFQTRSFPLNFPIMLGLTTNADGVTTILSCSRETTNKSKAASGQGVIDPSSGSNATTIDLMAFGFSPEGKDPHFMVSENNAANGWNESSCGFTKISKFGFLVECSPKDPSSGLPSTFDWIAIQN